jgi:hypothetical protein
MEPRASAGIRTIRHLARGRAQSGVHVHAAPHPVILRRVSICGSSYFTQVFGQALSMSSTLPENVLPPLGQVSCEVLLRQPMP